MNAIVTGFEACEASEGSVDRYELSAKANMVDSLTDAVYEKMFEVSYIKADGSRDVSMDHLFAMTTALKSMVGELHELCEKAELKGLC